MVCYIALCREIGKSGGGVMIFATVLEKIEEAVTEQGEPVCVGNTGLGRASPASVSPGACGHAG